MNIGDATREKILKICKKRNITINKLCTLSGITQSTIDNFMRKNTKAITLQTLQYICEGLNIKIYDFFNDNVFDDLDNEKTT